MMMITMRAVWLISSVAWMVGEASCYQKWSQQPRYQEVNPKGTVVLPCIILNKQGECRWEQDGSPIGIQKGKYEWAASPESGDCSLKIINAKLEYDDGVWQCQVTPSSFNVKDALISEGAELVVREKPKEIVIQRVGDKGAESILASAGEDLELECITTGANPPAKLRWFLVDQEIHSGHRQENSRADPSYVDEGKTWTSISRLTLPVSKGDNGATIKCLAEHPALMAGENLVANKALTIHYPPYVSVEHSALDDLEEERDSVTLRCSADSNPPPTIWWHKEGIEGIFSPESEIVISPVTRSTAGIYKCIAENALGLSEPSYVEVGVKYPPSIVTVGPSRAVFAQMYNQTRLTCHADGNPQPEYQWLQKLPTHEVLIRGSGPQLLIANVTYDQQGEYVCKATNRIRGELRAIQSEPIILEVTGAPLISRYAVPSQVTVHDGEDAVLEVRFCADPLPEQLWHLGSTNSNNVILAAGTQHGRFVAEVVRKLRDDCYISALRVNGAHPSDSNIYELRLSNSHGVDTHQIQLIVKEQLSPEILIAIAVVVGCVLTILILTLFILYAVRAEKCCGLQKKKKSSDIESDRTDVDSTHSSNVSAFNRSASSHCGLAADKSSIIPPDALYATSTKKLHQSFHNPYHHHHHHHHQFSVYDPSTGAVLNNSKESLPTTADLVSVSNLNRCNSSSGELNVSQQTRISFHDLCFPKTSNYGSMKKKKHNVGVDCRLNEKPQQLNRPGAAAVALPQQQQQQQQQQRHHQC